MAEQPDFEEPNKKWTGADLIIPVAAIVFTIYYFTTIWSAPWTAQVSAFFVGAILMTLCAVFFLLFGLQWRSGQADFSFDRVINPTGAIPKRLLLFALMVGYIFVIDWVGFIITTFLFLTFAMLLLTDGKHRRLIVSLSATLAIGGYLLFVVAFQRQFPNGPIEQWLRPLWISLGVWE
jgi:hypothetical protein